jgi:CelD/BcsL family acetyltransferase involved in cellulose biosynthesis
VVFDDGEPVGVMLNYMSEETIHVAITVFDVDYSKFSVGTVNIMKLIEWALENRYRVVDLSKGHYDYKKRWGSLKYNFEYHILYNSKSLYSTFLAVSLKIFFGIKHFFRKLGVNELVHKISFAINRHM